MVCIKITDVSDVAQCSLVGDFNQAIWCHTQDDSNLHISYVADRNI